MWRIVLAIIAFTATTAGAYMVILQWSPNTEPDLAGYKVKRSNTNIQPFANSSTVGNVTTATFRNLSGVNWFAVTAYNTSGTESAYSNTVVVGRQIKVELFGVGSRKTVSADGILSCTSYPCYVSEISLTNPLLLSTEPDITGGELKGWDGVCAKAENRPTCTLDLTSRLLQIQTTPDLYIPVSIITGYGALGTCKIFGGTGAAMYYNDLQTAYNVVQSGAGSSPIECLMGIELALNVNGTISVELSGGWISFSPPTAPDNTQSTLTGPLVIRTAPLVITGGGVIVK